MKKQSNRFPKKKVSYKVTNWREYNKALKQRGSLTIWLSEDLDENGSVASVERREERGYFVFQIGKTKCCKFQLIF